MVIWKGWFESAPWRASLATPFPALCPRILGTRFTNYGLRMFWGELMVTWKRSDLRLFLAERLWTPHFQPFIQEFSEHGLQITVCESPNFSDFWRFWRGPFPLATFTVRWKFHYLLRCHSPFSTVGSFGKRIMRKKRSKAIEAQQRCSDSIAKTASCMF